MKMLVKTMLLSFSLLTSDLLLADVMHNVTFIVKDNGSVEAISDLGTFDSTGKILTINSSQMPSEFQSAKKTQNKISEEYFLLWGPIGYLAKSDTSPGGSTLEMSIRVKSVIFNGLGIIYLLGGSCGNNTMAQYGQFLIDTTRYNLSKVNCDSTNGGVSGDYSYEFSTHEIVFQFMESMSGGLADLKLPAGRYEFAPKRFQFKHAPSNNPTIQRDWLVKVTVVVEPSISSVNIPTDLPIDVNIAANNQVMGQGSVTATITGSLGKYLRIEPRSSNAGNLIKGSERIPYTLSVTPLSGDNTPRLLIDGKGAGAQPPVNIETYARRDQYRLRFDAAFNASPAGLSSGRFSDNVTLIFTTPDLP
ncbi:hypothetical protein [Aeromonas jandaei]|uniref:hypothetical protein n=1 Tax=Aeromonas jandaei TaxID=650 RepID=UPI003B9E3E5D